MKSTPAISIIVAALTGCCSSPRFTHIDVNGSDGKGPAPYVMFDQKTGRMCWAGQDTANGATVTITTVTGTDYQQTRMPVCGDLVTGKSKPAQ
jgi:hypothetical protein